jgi:histidyl-tRNA synthetase
MAEKRKFQAIKGTRDLLPPETELWNRVEATAREVFGTYGYGEIRPPIFEPTELFARAVGGDTDIVSKEMYTFFDLPSDASAGIREVIEDTFSAPEGMTSAEIKQRVDHSRNISLRPEATASVCRAYIEHNMNQWPAPVKLYYTGPMFRRERPQKGRYRQFYQIGAEVLGGSDAPGIDAEVIEMVMAFFGRLELQGVQLDINSIGHNAPECRRGYVEKVRAALMEVKDKLGEDSRRRIETNPLRVLDSKLEHEQAIIATLPKIGDSLCDDCKAHYAEVKRQLEMRDVAFKENWRLVRGLDYYMRTTFEITAQGLGSQNAVCGGGRYDGLVELLGGPPTKGIGFAIGEDRLILSLLEARKEVASGEWRVASGRDVYVAWMGKGAEAAAIAAARKLREAGLRVELPAVEQKFGKALGQADRLGARFALILGEDEVASGLWTVKNLKDGAQVKVAEGDVVEFFRGKK